LGIFLTSAPALAMLKIWQQTSSNLAKRVESHFWIDTPSGAKEPLHSFLAFRDH
jgi:hypothetical protein